MKKEKLQHSDNIVIPMNTPQQIVRELILLALIGVLFYLVIQDIAGPVLDHILYALKWQ